jgi:hypothetical protein
LYFFVYFFLLFFFLFIIRATCSLSHTSNMIKAALLACVVVLATLSAVHAATISVRVCHLSPDNANARIGFNISIPNMPVMQSDSMAYKECATITGVTAGVANTNLDVWLASSPQTSRWNNPFATGVSDLAPILPVFISNTPNAANTLTGNYVLNPSTATRIIVLNHYLNSASISYSTQTLPFNSFYSSTTAASLLGTTVQITNAASTNVGSFAVPASPTANTWYVWGVLGSSSTTGNAEIWSMTVTMASAPAGPSSDATTASVSTAVALAATALAMW